MKDHTELLTKARNRLQSLMLSMAVHPDCTEGSEFDDMTSLAQDLIDEIDEELITGFPTSQVATKREPPLQDDQIE